MRTKITKHGEILNIFIIKLYLENSIGIKKRKDALISINSNILISYTQLQIDFITYQKLKIE